MTMTPPIARDLMNWQPIETAPRDGTWFFARTRAGQMRVVHFADRYDRLPISHDSAVWATFPKEWIALSDGADLLAGYIAQADEIERLRDFIEDFIDAKPEIISGRDPYDRSGQSDVPDMIEADYFWSLQTDAINLLKEPKP